MKKDLTIEDLKRIMRTTPVTEDDPRDNVVTIGEAVKEVWDRLGLRKRIAVFRLRQSLLFMGLRSATARADKLIKVDELKLLARTDYPAYLLSDHWIGVRDMMRKRAGHRCQLCNSGKAIQVHHRTYERLGEELPRDLIVLCADCHGKFHDKLPPRE